MGGRGRRAGERADHGGPDTPPSPTRHRGDAGEPAAAAMMEVMARGGERERRRTADGRSTRRPRAEAGGDGPSGTTTVYDWVQEELDDLLDRGAATPQVTAPTDDDDITDVEAEAEVAVADPEAAGDAPDPEVEDDAEVVVPAPVDARRARRSARWRRVRQVAAVAVLAGVVAVPVTLRFQLDDERDRLARAEQQASGARTAQLGVEAEVAADAADLTNREVEAVAAARLAREARARLAASGVSEAALFETLDATERRVQGVEALRLAVAEAIARQDRILPEARGCIDEAIRALGRSAIAVATGRGSLSGSGSSCASMGPGR